MYNSDCVIYISVYVKINDRISKYNMTENNVSLKGVFLGGCLGKFPPPGLNPPPPPPPQKTGKKQWFAIPKIAGILIIPVAEPKRILFLKSVTKCCVA